MGFRHSLTWTGSRTVVGADRYRSHMTNVGKGHIERLPNGSYRVRVYAGTDPLTGKEIRLKATAKTGRTRCRKPRNAAGASPGSRPVSRRTYLCPRSLSGLSAFSWSGVAAAQPPGGCGGQHDGVAAQHRESGPWA